MTTGPDPAPLVDEQLSAWLDDELPAAELELLCTRAARSPEHQARLARYSLIGSALRGGRSGTLAAELAAMRLSSRVRSALDGPADPASQSEPGRVRPLLPYALAAGLALIAVALVPLMRPADGLPRPAPAPGPSLAAVPVAADRPASLSPTRLTNYLVYHGEYSGTLSVKLTDSHIVNQPTYLAAAPAVGRLPTR